ncbi:CapA family protein [Miniphocaeibacter halophilus]|uniref:CapA family protein n=1 Tax=Miniphocaeibacter halophilus TaxID=2931922 RepID=A0AC61MSP2_9FIRM|nr:CapA family protein [Miniphocaeibacter halophilus]QQK08680.1 CapA family protein [Miniphocaeibacter halophilus]
MKKYFVKIMYTLFLLSFLVSCNSKTEAVKTTEIENKEKVESEQVESEQEDRIETVKITATGDIMYHPGTFNSNVNAETGKYDFRFFYNDMEKYIQAADLMIGNYETTSTPTRELSDYPMFNTPENSIEDLKNAGFDILTTANNHCLDSRVQGIIDTIDALDKYGVRHTGTWKEGEKDYLIEEVNGIKIGVLAYTERFNGMEVILADNEKEMVSPLNEEQIEKDIKELKSKDVDIILVFPHWGEEYMTMPTEKQKELGHKILNWGADMVLGSHPHVVQPVEKVEVDGKDKYIVYSLGNSISGQRKEFLGIEGVEGGLFVEMEFTKDFKNKTTEIKSINFVPTYVRDDRSSGKIQYKTQPIVEYLEGGSLRETVSSGELNEILKLRTNMINVLESMEYKLDS